MTESAILVRLGCETSVHHLAADNDRLSIMGASIDIATYGAFLCRIHGFEAPLEAAFAMTNGLDELVDLRSRHHLRLLRSDLQSLGVIDPMALPRCSTAVFPFRHPADALGWMYALERNTLLHGVIERHLRGRLPYTMKIAGAYFSAQMKSAGTRLGELAAAMTRVAQAPANAERMITAAKAAFRCQHGWYLNATPARQQVA